VNVYFDMACANRCVPDGLTGIESTDTQIDALVYELYGLTEGEIRLVEG